MGKLIGVIMAILRFLNFQLYIVLLLFAVPFGKELRSLRELFEPPYSHYYPGLYNGSKLAVGSGALGMGWVLLSFPYSIPVGDKHGRSGQLGYLAFAIGDFVVVIALIAAMSLQSTYMPKPTGRCRNAALQNPDLWENGTSLYHIIAAHENATATKPADKTTPAVACSYFTTIWGMEMALLIVTVLDFLLTVNAAGFRSWLLYLYRLGSPPRRLSKRMNEKKSLRDRRKSQDPPVTSSALKCEPPQNGIALDVLTVTSSSGRLYEPGSTLEKYLEFDDLLYIISEDWHHADVRSLMLVSKNVRHILLVSRRAAMLRRRTCAEEGAGTCWSCSVKICVGCKRQRSVPEPPTKIHIDNCRPVCSKCYYKYCCKNISHTWWSRYTGLLVSNRNGSRASKQDYEHPKMCLCYPGLRALPGAPDRNYVTYSTHHDDNNRTSIYRLVSLCRDCDRQVQGFASYNLLFGNVEQQRLERDKRTLQKCSHIAIQECHSKAGVKEQISCQLCPEWVLLDGSEPMWWVCKICRNECGRDDLHPAWRNPTGLIGDVSRDTAGDSIV